MALLIIILILIFCFWIPSFALFLLVPFSSNSDGRGIIEYLSLQSSWYLILIRMSFFVFLGYGFLLYVNKKRRLISSISRRACDVSIVIGFFIILSNISNGLDLFRATQSLLYTPIPYFFLYMIWINENVKFFRIFISTQIIIAFLVIVFPFFEFIDASIYISNSGEYVGRIPYSDIDVRNFDEIDKIKLGQYAHFHNPNALGFYSVIAISVGLYALYYEKKFNLTNLAKIIFPILILSLGIFGWINSFTRGPMIGLIASFILNFLIVRGKKLLFKALFFSIAIIFIISLFFIYYDYSLMDYLLLSTDSRSVTSRITGIENGFLAVLSNPIFGVGEQWDWPSDAVSHLLPLTYAAKYGILTGFFIFYLVFYLPIYLLFINKFKHRSADFFSFVSIYLIIIGIALTNNTAATGLFGFSLAFIFKMDTFNLLRSNREIYV